MNQRQRRMQLIKILPSMNRICMMAKRSPVQVPGPEDSHVEMENNDDVAAAQIEKNKDNTRGGINTKRKDQKDMKTLSLT